MAIVCGIKPFIAAAKICITLASTKTKRAFDTVWKNGFRVWHKTILISPIRVS